MKTFAFELLRSPHLAQGNLFFSPLSLYQALAMASLGAQGDTLRQIQGVLWMSDPNLPFLGEEVASANRIWLQTGQACFQNFLDALGERFQSTIEALDFQNHSEVSRARINAWVSEQTRKKISELIRPGVLNSRTEMVITNAIYFKAFWQKSFDPEQTAEDIFLCDSNTKKSIPFLNSTGPLDFSENEKFQMIRKPYQGGELAFVAVLPKSQGGLLELDLANFLALSHELKPVQVQLQMPKFKSGSVKEMSQVLRSMGIVDAFDSKRADFGGIRELRRGETLSLSHVIHEAVIEIDEKGTEAAAATALAVVRTLSLMPRKPIEVRFKRPFFYGVIHTQTQTPLFLGRLENP